MNEKFSGFNTAVENFFQLYEDIAAINNWNDATKLIVMPMYLSGPAYYFYKTKKTSSTTYKDMKFFFETEFGELKNQPVQTGPLLSEQTTEQQKTVEPPADKKVESELKHEENSEDVAPTSTTEPTETDQAPVECAIKHNEKHHDEAPISTSTTESISHFEEKKINTQDKNREINLQNKNSMENEEDEKTKLEKTSLSSGTAVKCECESDNDIAKSEKTKEISTSKSMSEISDNLTEKYKNKAEEKIAQKTRKPKSCKPEEMKMVLVQQETPQPSERKENRRESSWKALRKNCKLQQEDLQPSDLGEAGCDSIWGRLRRNIQIREIGSDPKESDDSHATNTQVNFITAEEKQTKVWEHLVKNGFPYDRGKWR